MNIKIVNLFKIFMAICYLHIKKAFFLVLSLFAVFTVIFNRPIIAIYLAMIIFIAVCVHEFGHVFFLERYKLEYELQATSFSLKVTFCLGLFYKLSTARCLFIICGGALFSTTYYGFLLIIFHSNYLVIGFIKLLIMCEILNLFIGQDGKMLGYLIKERKNLK